MENSTRDSESCRIIREVVKVYRKYLTHISLIFMMLILLGSSVIVKAGSIEDEIYEQNIVKVADDTPSSIDSINPANYADKIGNVSDADSLRDMGNIIIGIVQFVGSAVSVLALIVIGIKYMMGSLEEKAQYKETMKPYIVGAILVFGISNIVGIIASIAESI